jgi:trk/ktr system potassium uptake protein
LELADRMDHGLAIPLAGGKEMLYRADVASGAPAEGRSLRTLEIPDKVLIVSILRGDATLLPDGNTVLTAGDRMIVAATPDSMEAFRALISTAV